MNTRNHEKDVEHNFDYFCKKILKGQAIDIQRQINRLSKREVSFSELSAHELEALAVMDEYFKDAHVFDVHGENVGVTDCDLAEALKSLSADKRNIVLMAYFFDMNDREIAELLKMARRTVAHQRANILKELRKLMESEE